MLTQTEYPWLPESGWLAVRIVDNREVLSIYERHKELCDILRREGKELFDLDTIPELKGTLAPPPFQNGTGGNLALLIPETKKFIITASATHKGHLGENDFAKIEWVDWKKKGIYFQSDAEGKLPSTDSLLVAWIFKKHPNIETFVHFHCAVRTPHAVKLSYPSFKIADRKKLSALIASGAWTLNMIDHNLFVKSAPDGTPDAAIVIGVDPVLTFARARVAIRNAQQNR